MANIIDMQVQHAKVNQFSHTVYTIYYNEFRQTQPILS